MLFERFPARRVPVSSATSRAILQRVAVERLEEGLFAHETELLAVPVVSERLHHVRAGMDEFTVQLAHDLGVLEHDLGNERTGLEVASALALEQVTLGADDRALLEPLQQAGSGGVGHIVPSSS